jgi:hypothetical protein
MYITHSWIFSALAMVQKDVDMVVGGNNCRNPYMRLAGIQGH